MQRGSPVCLRSSCRAGRGGRRWGLARPCGQLTRRLLNVNSSVCRAPWKAPPPAPPPAEQVAPVRGVREQQCRFVFICSGAIVAGQWAGTRKHNNAEQPIMALAADRSLLLGSMHMSYGQQGHLTAAPTGHTPDDMGWHALAHCTHLLMGNRVTVGRLLSASPTAGSAPVAASGASAPSPACTAGRSPGNWPPEIVTILQAAQLDWTAALTCSVKAPLSFRALCLHTGHRGRRLLSH